MKTFEKPFGHLYGKEKEVIIKITSLLYKSF